MGQKENLKINVLKLDVDDENSVKTAIQKILDEKTIEVNNYDDFKTELEKGRLIKAPICDNQECEEKIKEESPLSGFGVMAAGASLLFVSRRFRS